MCDKNDAKRNEELALLLVSEGNTEKAREHYLEAASIYLLQSELKKDDSLIKKANECYRKSAEIIGKKIIGEYPKQELARIILYEQNEQGEKKMCGMNSIKTLLKLGKTQEKTDPKKAAKSYLKAAELLLHESEHDAKREDEYIAMANKVYVRAKQLKKTGKDSQFKQAEIVKKKQNKITFKDIGGLKDLKEEIRFKIIEPFKNPDIFKYYKKPIGGGILMYGPPGCGKSLIAQATANEANATFVHVKCSDLKSKFVGETEKNIAELFRKARETQPTIIFFDEFEALGGDRTESHSHEKSAVAQLLTEIDGVDSKDQQILLLAATNEPWSIDPALRREGRFGNTIYIPQPDIEARKQIFKLVMEKRPIKELDFKLLAKVTQGISGADIKAICEMATDIPLRKSLSTGKKMKITMNDMQAAIRKTQSVMKQWFSKAKTQVKKKKLEESFKELFVASNKIDNGAMV